MLRWLRGGRKVSEFSFFSRAQTRRVRSAMEAASRAYAYTTPAQIHRDSTVGRPLSLPAGRRCRLQEQRVDALKYERLEGSAVCEERTAREDSRGTSVRHR